MGITIHGGSYYVVRFWDNQTADHYEFPLVIDTSVLSIEEAAHAAIQRVYQLSPAGYELESVLGDRRFGAAYYATVKNRPL